MPTEPETDFHRSFLSHRICVTIWNEDYAYQSIPSGPPNRKMKIQSDPVYAYHVQAAPHWPAKPPFTGPDRGFDALLAGANGSLVPLVIITKRGMPAQNFASAATPWELKNSVMCGIGKFRPIVNSMMEVTGHSANLPDYQLLHPKGVDFSNPSDYIDKEIPLYLWLDGSSSRDPNVPEGWEQFKEFYGGIDVLVRPNGEVIGANGQRFQSNNGHAVSVISPLDFWTPGSRLAAAAIRGLTNRIGAAAVRGLKVLTAPSKEVAQLSIARLGPKTLPGVAVSRSGALPVKIVGRRAVIFGDDVAKFEGPLATTKTEEGFFDIAIHGTPESFEILEKGVWKKVSTSEVANAVRPMLGPNDNIRLLACSSASRGGPAQELADQLKRTVWAPSKAVYPRHGVVIKNANDEVVKFSNVKSFVPEGGKFYQFEPAGGAPILSGPGRPVNQNVIRRPR